MKSTFPLLILIVLLLSANFQSCSSSEAKENKTETSKTSENAVKPKTKAKDTETASQNNATSETSSIDSDIQFIRDKYAIISKATNYTTVSFETECNERYTASLGRKYNEKEQLAYLEFADCSEHGCTHRQYYFWEDQLIFIYSKNDYMPGASHIVEEYRSYIKDGKMIRCLDKKAQKNPGDPPVEDLLKKASNKQVDCNRDRLSKKLNELKTLSPQKAKDYFCSF